MSDPQPLWTGDVRRDGVHIVLTEHGFAIVPPDRVRTVTHCPCCGNSIRSVRAAKLITDGYFPIND